MTMLKTALYAGVAGLLLASGGAFAQSTQGSQGTSPGTSPGTTAPDATTPGTSPSMPSTTDPYGEISPEAGATTGSAGSGSELGTDAPQTRTRTTGKSQADKEQDRLEREQTPPTQGPER